MTDFLQLKSLTNFPDIFQASSIRTIDTLEKFLNTLKINNYVISEQIHENNIFLAENIQKPTLLSGYDAFITKQKNLALIIKTADCTPIFLYDPIQKAIGVIHAGRKSTLLQITSLTVNKMREIFASEPKNIIAGLGPAICKNCYQIDPVQDIHFDLWEENKKQLINICLNSKNIELSGLCPACNAQDRFYSYRREKTKLRTYNIIMLKA